MIIKKEIKAYNISYDTDGVKIKLPKELTFMVDAEFDPEYELADLISDKTGWCVNSFKYKWTKKA